jgi:hypothetical protein
MLLDLRSRGVTINPIQGMAGIPPFSEIFLEEVRIPAQSLVGEENKGWQYVVASLDYERAWAGLCYSAQSRRLVDDLTQLTLNAPAPAKVKRKPILNHKLADLVIQVEVSRLLAYRACLLVLGGGQSSAECAMSKLFSTELSQRAAQVGMELLGLYGQGDASVPGVPLGGGVLSAYLSCVANTLLAGTSEVERNIIAQRGLNLPR